MRSDFNKMLLRIFAKILAAFFGLAWCPTVLAEQESVQPTSMKIFATNPLLEHKSNIVEHTIRGLGRDVSAEYEIIHPTYTVKLSSWSGKPNHEHWSEFGPSRVVSVGQISTLEAKGERLSKIAVNVSEMTWGHIIVPHHHNVNNPRIAGGEPHIKMELVFYADNGSEVAKWLVESTFGADNTVARNWKAKQILASPRVTVALPTDSDRCNSLRCFIVKVAPRGDSDLVNPN